LLLLTTATGTNVHSELPSGDDALPADEELGEYLRLGESSLADDFAQSDDVVDRERQAVDAVLSELHDFSKMPIERLTDLSAPGDRDEATDSIELDSDVLWGGAAIADTEGGMVMLVSTGDPNQSVFDLAGVSEGGVDVLQVRAGLEATVGFYQVMDVATEEAPAVRLPSTNPAVELPRETSTGSRFSNEAGKESSGKAAAAVGATTFIGALLWANRKSRSKDERNDESAR
jgi:hypothetical protein